MTHTYTTGAAMMLMLSILCWSTTGWAQTTHEEHTRATLTLTGQPPTMASPLLCFTEQSLRDHINAQLGYDAFDSLSQEPKLVLRIFIEQPNASSWQARISVKHSDSPERTRTLSTSQCNDLLDAIVFSVTLVLDPVRASSGHTNTTTQQASALIALAQERAKRHTSIHHASTQVTKAHARGVERAKKPFPIIVQPPQPVAITPERTSKPAAGIRVEEPKESTTRKRAARRVLAGMGAQTGALPSPHLALTLGVRTHGTTWAFDTALTSSIPHIYPSFEGNVTLSAHQIELAGCRGWRPSLHMLGCVRAAGGVFRGRGRDLAVSGQAHGVLAAVGLSLHPTLPLGNRYQLHLDATAMRHLARVTWIVGTEQVATNQAWNLGLGLSLSMAWRHKTQ